MGSTLCRRKRSVTDPAGTPRTSSDIGGLYRKIVLNYAKQWTRYSADKSSPKNREKNKKFNKIKKKKKKKKPTISGPYPADPDRLEGDKWRYVILTRLDTEPPPERPPRTKRRRSQRESTLDGGGSGRWGSERRRRQRRPSHGRVGRRRPQRAERPTDAADRDDRGHRDVSAAELMELVMEAYRRRPAARPSPSPWTAQAPGEGVADQPVVRPAPVRTVLVRSCSWTRPWSVARRTGLFDSVNRVGAMVDNLLL